MFSCKDSRWPETAVLMPGGLLRRPMGPSWTVYFRVGSSGQSQEILYLGRYLMRLDARRGDPCMVARVMLMLMLM